MKVTQTYLILFFVALCIQAGCKGREVQGLSALDFELDGIKGGKIRYSEFKGSPVILYFFASW